ncbi:PREDICTED: olfactory receptor 51I2-like [Tinamus guttatus]|uniref:olfactory receptor 51I2-like n=1 Tax=Tinamus guttatus TaxID=94827 RepID=UPI00052EEDC1|nr:PREDICTED: olfactory receptor 51I2-like [Tinamus guttatus]
MSSLNTTAFSQHPSFLLVGIPGLEKEQFWIAFPFSVMYAIAVVGNIALLVFIKTVPSLHEPMYLFLAMLAFTDLVLSTSSLPKMLSIFWLGSREISFHACLAQMFFIHCFSIMDSGVLWAMAFDRFVAIYNPLQYASILTNSRIGLIGLGLAVRSVILLIPLPVLLTRLPFCRSRVLAHSFCLHPNLIQLPCADVRVNSMYGLFVLLATFGLDSLFIVLSYVMIIKTVLSIASKEERLKALNTCISHICAVLIYYIPMIGLSMVYRFGKHVPPLIHVLMANIYLLVPPVLNPIIYSMKTKQIRRGICKLLTPK